MSKPLIWSIAGSDSGAGAGIQADVKTASDFGVHCATVITVITAQNSLGVSELEAISPTLLQAQLDALQSDLPPQVIKLGLLPNSPGLARLIDFLSHYTGFIISDPVIRASAGQSFYFDKSTYLKAILPQINLITPNIFEAQVLTGVKIQHTDDIIHAARVLLDYGVPNVVIKGGHFEAGPCCYDYWTNGVDAIWLTHERILTAHTHGSGCVFASAIASALAKGYELLDALVVAKMYVTQGLRLAQPLGQGSGPVVQGGFPKTFVDLPIVSKTPSKPDALAFPSCGPEPLGLYPIVDTSKQVAALIKTGLTTIQLRIKNSIESVVESEIKAAIHYARAANCRLFINDYWSLALRYGAYGVHLGQGDLDTADLAGIKAAGLRLGVSTHCFSEVARAHALRPSYIACGPIFPTTSKQMPFAPQGLTWLHYWCHLLDYPVVAIGGIDQHTLPLVRQAGSDGFAMIRSVNRLCNFLPP